MDRPDREELNRRVRAGLLRARQNFALQVCLVPECNTGAPIVKAHSIQQSNILNRIADDGHIYTFRPQVSGNELVRLGVNKASVFTGFCATHDNELFRPVDFDECTRVDVESIEQIARLSLRAIACEHWKKLCAERVYSRLHELSVSGKAEELGALLNVGCNDVKGYMDFYAKYARASLAGTNDAIRRMRRWFLSLLSQIQRGKYHLSKTCAFQLSGEPVVAASAGFPVEWDLHGNRVATKKKTEDTPEVALNVIPSDGGSVVMFLWHRRFDKRLTQFFSELRDLDNEQQRTVLSQLIIMRCENIAIAPRLVESWTENEQAAVVGLFCSTLAYGRPFSDAPRLSLFNA